MGMSSSQDQRELNKQVVQRLLMDCFSGGHIEVLDEIISPDFEFEYPNLPPSIEGLKALVKKNNESFKGWQFSIHDMLADGDKVALRWSASGVHVKSFLGEPPSGKEVRLKGLSIYQLRDGLIWKDWVEPDNLGFMTQLGLVAPVDFLAEGQ
jgi:predicted ester cyclase